MSEKTLHRLAALSGLAAGVAPVAGALPEGTPKGVQITVTVLGLLITLVTAVGKVFGKGEPPKP